MLPVGAVTGEVCCCVLSSRQGLVLPQGWGPHGTRMQLPTCPGHAEESCILSEMAVADEGC